METKRRDFIKILSLASGAMALSGNLTGCRAKANEMDYCRVSQLKKPVAIAMWDFSWILRHHKFGEFEDWDQVLQGLAERGYNAIRMDAMPQFVAADTDGTVKEEFRSCYNSWKPALWGNQYSMSFRPREALLEFLPKCEKYGIKVGLASWFMRHGTNRSEIFTEKDAVYRAWDETLSFLKSHDLLRNVMYVDLLNEYPYWHGYDWLKNELNSRSDVEKFKMNNPDANIPDADQDNKKHDESETVYDNPVEIEFYNLYANDLLTRLKSRYPELDFLVSFSKMNLDNIDLSNYGALDYHLWFQFVLDSPEIWQIHARNAGIDHREVYAAIKTCWSDDKARLTEWMNGRIAKASRIAREHNIVCGNTEGWGSINWWDHPELGWDWIKECAKISVDACLQHDNYKFICTSNFTHPQFKGMWDDVSWHRTITDRIKTKNYE
ncbi:MAG: hypothetical protein GY790_19230 [Bacteroidetes bacterium]|nr:hypothetical protein [Bacteroidota bacterium]